MGGGGGGGSLPIVEDTLIYEKNMQNSIEIDCLCLRLTRAARISNFALSEFQLINNPLRHSASGQ